jgi:hypothetical protein
MTLGNVMLLEGKTALVFATTRRDLPPVAQRFVNEGADICISTKVFRAHQWASAMIDEEHFNDF